MFYFFQSVRLRLEKANVVTKEEESSEASTLQGAVMKSCTHKRLLGTRIKECEEALPLWRGGWVPRHVSHKLKVMGSAPVCALCCFQVEKKHNLICWRFGRFRKDQRLFFFLPEMNLEAQRENMNSPASESAVRTRSGIRWGQRKKDLSVNTEPPWGFENQSEKSTCLESFWNTRERSLSEF